MRYTPPAQPTFNRQQRRAAARKGLQQYTPVAQGDPDLILQPYATPNPDITLDIILSTLTHDILVLAMRASDAAGFSDISELTKAIKEDDNNEDTMIPRREIKRLINKAVKIARTAEEKVANAQA